MIHLHKEGRGSVILALLIAVLLSLFSLWFFGVNLITILFSLVILVLLCGVVYFFRDPNRECVESASTDVLSSADGKVVIIKEVEEDEYLKCKVIQVSVFMSIFNVHVNYYPIDGKVVYFKDHPGDYLVAWHPKSSIKNERTSVVIESGSGRKILVRQIAGYVARRIVCYAKEGESIAKGDEMGFIKFGSRVDFFLPIDSKIVVKEGDRVRACTSVIAQLP